jgi:hypothetical protein
MQTNIILKKCLPFIKMSCSSCNGGCNCNGTIRSRRCSCQQPSGGGVFRRDQVNCDDNQMFVNHSIGPEEDNSPYLMTTEAYGSGLSTVGLTQLRVFNQNLERYNSGYSQPRRRTNGESRGISPMTKLQAANAIRYGRDITIQ